VSSNCHQFVLGICTLGPSIFDIFSCCFSVGSDYADVFASLQFDSGSGPGSVESFNINIVDDLLVENQETISLIATSQFGTFNQGDDQATVAIIDNDGKHVYLVKCADLYASAIDHNMVCILEYYMTCVFLSLWDWIWAARIHDSWGQHCSNGVLDQA